MERFIALFVLSLFAATATAQYPVRPIRLVVPAAPGGGTDISTRSIVLARLPASGARLSRPVENQFYGDRRGTIEDPYGHIWHVATHIEDPSEAEVIRRLQKLAKQAHG